MARLTLIAMALLSGCALQPPPACHERDMQVEKINSDLGPVYICVPRDDHDH